MQLAQPFWGKHRWSLSSNSTSDVSSQKSRNLPIDKHQTSQPGCNVQHTLRHFSFWETVYVCLIWSLSVRIIQPLSRVCFSTCFTTDLFVCLSAVTLDASSNILFPQLSGDGDLVSSPAAVCTPDTRCPVCVCVRAYYYLYRKKIHMEHIHAEKRYRSLFVYTV